MSPPFPIVLAPDCAIICPPVTLSLAPPIRAISPAMVSEIPLARAMRPEAKVVACPVEITTSPDKTCEFE